MPSRSTENSISFIQDCETGAGIVRAQPRYHAHFSGGHMRPRRYFAPAIITVLALGWLSGHTIAEQKSIKEQLVGTWSFVSSNAKLTDGRSLWGEHAKGLFIITQSGHFSWQVFRSDRPRFASHKRLEATPAELKANNQGMLAYFGTYSVNEADSVVTFFTQASTFPNSEGEVIERIITRLTADELVYTNPANTSGQRVEAVWKRAK